MSAETQVTLYREIDALGGIARDDSDRGYNKAIRHVLEVLERRGFSEAADAGAALELLSALRWLRAFWVPGSNHDTQEVQEALAVADAAILKATGA